MEKEQLVGRDLIRQQEGRSADILAVRAALKEGKTLTLTDAKAQREARELREQEDRRRMPPPPVIPRPRDSKAGNLPRERPAIGQSQAASSENFGTQFQDMKKQLVQGDGESRKDFKKRIHASLRAVKKGGEPITTEEQPRRQPTKTQVSPYTPPPRSSPPVASEESNDREGPTRAELVARDKVDVPKEGVLKAGFVATAKLAARKEDWERLS